LSPLNFPLPDHLATRLKGINEVVYKDRGFVVLRGLDPRKYSEEDIVLLYVGICSRVTNRRGNTLGKWTRPQCSLKKHVLTIYLDHIVESSELRTSDEQMGLSGAEQDGPMVSTFYLYLMHPLLTIDRLDVPYRLRQRLSFDSLLPHSESEWGKAASSQRLEDIQHPC